LYQRLWSLLRPLAPELQYQLIDSLSNDLGVRVELREDHRAMSAEELSVLARTPGMTIGSHTEAHSYLPASAQSRRVREIAGSKTSLERRLGLQVSAFSYPFGESDYRSRRLVRTSGYSVATVNVPPTFSRRRDVFLVPRVPMKDWSGVQLRRVLARKSAGAARVTSDAAPTSPG
jgi:peptidoglycan/xylan/chitin deacetylase (PgdA/CDA1 family)